jgi:hypothetical protein
MKVLGVEEVENALKPLVGTLLNANCACELAAEATVKATSASNLATRGAVRRGSLLLVIWVVCICLGFLLSP